jgi:hypothetical protein
MIFTRFMFFMCAFGEGAMLRLNVDAGWSDLERCRLRCSDRDEQFL